MSKPTHRARPSRLLLGFFLLLTGLPLGAAPVSALQPADIERRNAAAAFVQIHELTLQMLRVECGTLMPTESARVDALAKAWFTRNKDDIVSARVWLDQYLSHAKSVSAELHQRESNALLTALSNGMLDTAKTHFHRQPPSAEGCANALRAYAAPEFDVQNMGGNRGYEQFAEFGKTLQAMRQATDYSVPPHINTQFPESLPFRPYASMEAASAARERGDGAMLRTVYTRLAEHGESTAAQAMGMAYLTGELAPKDYVLAYRWFAAAWSLGNSDGLNAMGVLLRDGVGVEVNTRLAYGTFLLAQQGARDQAAYDRSKRNADSVQTKISDTDHSALACMTIEAFDTALQTAAAGQPLVRGNTIVQGQRRLGQVIRDLESVKLSDCR
ncbi:MAG: hypothetical protein V4858_27980 [Pseudomonadota bacterium]